MGRDMRSASLEWLWAFGRVIFVDREGTGTGDRGGVRGWLKAIRHLKSGGALGVFPEGYIERPAQRVLPFLDGVGLLIARTKAEVLPVVIDGTPRVGSAWGSIWKSSRTRLRFLEPMTFDDESEPGEIAVALRQRFLDATGWATNEQPPVFREGEWWYLEDDGSWKRAAEFGLQA